MYAGKQEMCMRGSVWKYLQLLRATKSFIMTNTNPVRAQRKCRNCTKILNIYFCCLIMEVVLTNS